MMEHLQVEQVASAMVLLVSLIVTETVPGNGNNNEVTMVSHDIPVDGYMPGTTYNITVSCNGPGTTSFDFRPAKMQDKTMLEP